MDLKEKEVKVVVAKPVNGIGLNGLEYIMDPKTSFEEYLGFSSKEEAISYLIKFGVETDEIEDYFFKKYNFKIKQFIE